VAWLPLKEEWREKFDVDKAWEFVNNLLGTPFGH
jgi:hypothetical protein